ncbi:MAG: hypothetical protein AB4290_17080 [Spirulina sp.]
MNQRKIWLSGIITAAVGVGIGLILAKLIASPFTSPHYRKLRRVYMIVCGTGGLVVGASQEALRQLQVQRDREEEALRQLRGQRDREEEALRQLRGQRDREESQESLSNHTKNSTKS